MKKYLLFIISLLIFSFYACHKTNPVVEEKVTIYEPGKMEFGFATFSKNGLSAKSSGEAVRWNGNKNQYRLYFYTYQTASNGITYSRELYEIRQIPYGKIGKYTIKFDNLSNLTNVLGSLYSGTSTDILTPHNDYDIDESKDNYVNITSVDSSNVTGSFQMYLKVRKPKTFVEEPDSLQITNGFFDVKMKNI